MTKEKKGAHRTGSTEARKGQIFGGTEDLKNGRRKIRNHCDGQPKPVQRGPRGRVGS